MSTNQLSTVNITITTTGFRSYPTFLGLTLHGLVVTMDVSKEAVCC